MTPYWIILFLILFALAMPVWFGKGFWPHVPLAMVMSFFVVVLPLFVFAFSSFMVPEWKGACRYGWVDCFIVGKLAFSPFVLVATAALYRLEVLREKNVGDKWFVGGIYLGAMVAVTCAVFGLVCVKWQGWLLVPIYVAVWYAIRAVQLMIQSTVGFWAYLWATLLTVPAWLTSWQWSRQVYESLPNQAPSGCFVVTAAGRGHPNVVGPFFEIEHAGKSCRANQQLITLWQFEERWRKQFPLSHAAFRRIYNRFGSLIAARIRSQWQADVMFLILKPAEWLANIYLNKNHTTKL
jgi:hypothetical protein